jgi:hypothetical protein
VVYTSDRLDQVLLLRSSCWRVEMYRTPYRGKRLVNDCLLPVCTDRQQVEQVRMVSRRCFDRVLTNPEKIDPGMRALSEEKANLERMDYKEPTWVGHFVWN